VGCVLSLSLALASSACAAGTERRSSPSPPPSTQPPRGFPGEFPLAPGGRIERAGAGPTGFALTLRVPSAEQALAFYRDALPRAGWRVSEGPLRPRGALVPGETTRFVGGLTFRRGRDDDESDPGGVEAYVLGDGARVALDVPRVGRAPRGMGRARPPQPAISASAPAPPQADAWGFPEGFPWPAGSRGVALARGGDGVLRATFDARSGAATWDFYRAALVQAGYETREVWQPDPDADAFVGRLAFHGHGRRGRVTLYADSARTRVELRFEPAR
jgi:hypothetical protein